MKLIVERSKQLDRIKLFISIFKLHKSYLLLISDQEELGIGNATLGSPPMIEGLKSTSASYQLVGFNKKLLSKIIAERASYLLKAPVLLLLFLKTKKDENEIAKPLVNFLNEVLSDIVEK